MLKVNEIFHSIQGESTHAGRPCTFVRLTGCPLRCRWCDTEYAFHEGRPASIADVLDRVAAYRCRLVEVTGGEPLAQPECPDLLRALLDAGYEVLLETSGAYPLDPVPEGVARIVDVKCPGSGETERQRWDELSRLRPGDEIKFVIAGRDDYEWAREKLPALGLPRGIPVLFSPVVPDLPAGRLADWLLADGLDVRMQYQLHKLLWPAATRGV